MTDKPSLIKIRTTIGYGAPKQGTEKVHGAPLGAKDVATAKTALGFDPAVTFAIGDDVKGVFAKLASQGAALEADHEALLAKYREAHPALAVELERRVAGGLPADWRAVLPTFKPTDSAAATRKHSQTVLNKLAPVIPELVGGSADLTHSNLTWLDCSKDYQKARATPPVNAFLTVFSSIADEPGWSLLALWRS